MAYSKNAPPLPHVVVPLLSERHAVSFTPIYSSIENSAGGRKYVVNQADGIRRVCGWWDSILLVLSL